VKHLEPPNFLSLNFAAQKSRVHWDALNNDDNDTESTSSDTTPTDRTWFLQPRSPLLPYEELGREDGKLGVISAINIIVGKTVGVGAYSVPSAIFAGVGSVGMTLLVWVLGSLISFCGLAVYLVRVL
jgi:hypothetical protein